MFARGHNDNVGGRTLCASTNHAIYTFVDYDAYDYLTNTLYAK